MRALDSAHTLAKSCHSRTVVQVQARLAASMEAQGQFERAIELHAAALKSTSKVREGPPGPWLGLHLPSGRPGPWHVCMMGVWPVAVVCSAACVLVLDTRTPHGLWRWARLIQPASHGWPYAQCWRHPLRRCRHLPNHPFRL